MTMGTLFAVCSFATAVGNLAFYYPKMTSNHATLRPRREQALMVLALLLAVASFFLNPGAAGYVLAGIAVIPALRFLLATLTSGLPRKEPVMTVGTIAPDFATTDADGRPFHLADMRGTAVLLKFYRGYWSPYCIAELAQLNRFAAEFAALGVRLVAVSSDRVAELRPFRRKYNWYITLLADPSIDIHRRYNVQHRKFAAKRGPFREIAIPTTILIDKDGRVLWLEQTTDFRVRPQADMVLAKAKALLSNTGANTAAEEERELCVA